MQKTRNVKQSKNDGSNLFQNDCKTSFKQNNSEQMRMHEGNPSNSRNNLVIL